MQKWPRPPRRVPLRVAFATWRGFGMVSIGLLLMSILFAIGYWVDSGCRSPRVDTVLDARDGCATARGVVVDAVRSKGKRGTLSDHAEYTFRFRDAGGTEIEAKCHGMAGVEAGAEFDVEYVIAAPTQARLRGMLHTKLSELLSWYPGAVVLPLVLALLLWLARVYRTYAIVRHGPAAAAILVATKELRGKRGPTSLRIRYRFRGNDGSDHESWQDERRNSPLATIALQTAVGGELDNAFVTFAEVANQRCRLVSCDQVGEATA